MTNAIIGGAVMLITTIVGVAFVIEVIKLFYKE